MDALHVWSRNGHKPEGAGRRAKSQGLLKSIFQQSGHAVLPWAKTSP